MSTKKKLWKVVCVQWWWSKDRTYHRPCAWMTAAFQQESGVHRQFARYLTGCRAKKLAKELDAYHRRVYPYQQEQHRTKFEAVPMGSK